MKRPIIFVVESGGLCGGVRVILEEATRLSQRGWQVSVFSLDAMPTWFALPASVEWRRFRDYPHMQAVMVSEDSWKIATWWRTAEMLIPALRGDEGCYLVQDIETEYYSQPSMREKIMSTYDLPLRRYTTSMWVQENLPGTAYVGIAIDHDLYKPMDLERKPNTIMAIPRRQALKGYRQLGELSRRLGKECELYTVGVHQARFSGAWRQHYVGLPDEDIVKMYNQMSLFVSTSQREGFCLPVLEAMACGTPVVTTDSDGNRQFCEDGVNCLMVDRHDMRRMAQSVKRMLSDKELRQKCVAGGLETAKRYTWDPVIDRLEIFLA